MEEKRCTSLLNKDLHMFASIGLINQVTERIVKLASWLNLGVDANNIINLVDPHNYAAGPDCITFDLTAAWREIL